MRTGASRGNREQVIEGYHTASACGRRGTLPARFSGATGNIETAGIVVIIDAAVDVKCSAPP